jgi:hypothetical protein
MTAETTPVSMLRTPSIGARISSVWDWTLSSVLVVVFAAQVFFADAIGWMGAVIGLLVILLVIQRLHSRRHQLERRKLESNTTAR